MVKRTLFFFSILEKTKTRGLPGNLKHSAAEADTVTEQEEGD